MRLHGKVLSGLVVACGLLALDASVAQGQEGTVQPKKKIFGYLNPKTGNFVALTPQVRPDVSSTPPTTGTISLTLTIKLASKLPASPSITCALDVNAVSQTENTTTYAVTDGEWIEEASSVATVSGSTATCTVNIPYSWVLPAAGTTSTSTTSNTLTAMFRVSAANSTTALVLRSSEQSLIEGEKVPASGTVSSYTANVTL